MEYSDPIRNINKLISRNPYLEKQEFSVPLKLRATDGKVYNTRVFNEDGILEISMLAKTERAKKNL